LLAPTPNPEARGPAFVGCPRLFIQYIRSYHPYLEAFSSIRNLRTRHAAVTKEPPNMVIHTLLEEKRTAFRVSFGYSVITRPYMKARFKYGRISVYEL
jgi:hypothetical protein